MQVQFSDERTALFQGKVNARSMKIMQSTQLLIDYFISVGYTDFESRSNIGMLSIEIKDLLVLYILGLTEPLKSKIQASELPFMDQTAKDYCVDLLSE